MPSLATILILWGIAAPLGTFGWMKAAEFFHLRAAVADAVKTTRLADAKQCNARIDSIAKELNDDAAKRVAEASAAVAALPPTPVDDPGLRSLCERSASCRNRKGQ
mgnify:FL=1